MASGLTRRFKQIARKGSSSKKTGWDNYRFIGPEAQEKYTDNYGTKAVVIERALAFEDYIIQQLNTVHELQRRGWQPFLTQQGYVYEELIREFYANLKDIEFYPDGPRIYSKLRGRDYMIGPDHFSTILQLPVVTDPDYHFGDEYATEDLVALLSKNNNPWDGAVYPQGELKDEYRILNIVSASSLIPQKRTTDLTVERASLLYAIMTGKQICARRLIGEVMNSHKSNLHKPAALPFGLFITKCAIKDGIKIASNEKRLHQEKAIDATTFNKSKSQKKKKKKESDTTSHGGTMGASSSVELSERLDALTLSFEQERQANAEWRDWQRQSMEREQTATASWREYQRHSIDVTQSEIHQMYLNQKEWGTWMSSQLPGFPPGQWESYPPPQ